MKATLYRNYMFYVCMQPDFRHVYIALDSCNTGVY